jgi:hypothetical protein
MESLISQYRELQLKRRALQREADSIEQQEKALKEQLVALSLTTGYRDEKFVACVETTEEPRVDSWPALLDYIKTTGETDLLEKRVMKSAVKKRWDDRQTVPGVVKTESYKLYFEPIK